MERVLVAIKENAITDDVTPAYEDDKKTQLLLMLILPMKLIRKRSYC